MTLSQNTGDNLPLSIVDDSILPSAWLIMTLSQNTGDNLPLSIVDELILPSAWLIMTLSQNTDNLPLSTVD